jgi:hypothetical protein
MRKTRGGSHMNFAERVNHRRAERYQAEKAQADEIARKHQAAIERLNQQPRLDGAVSNPIREPLLVAPGHRITWSA